MTNFNWAGLLIGMLAGGVFAALFFAGLAWGMKLALRRTNPIAILLPSAVLRIAVVIAGGWAVAVWVGTVAAVSFAVAFIVFRTVLLAWMQVPSKTEGI